MLFDSDVAGERHRIEVWGITDRVASRFMGPRGRARVLAKQAL